MNSPSYGAILYFLSRHKLMYGAILAVALPVSVLEGFSVAAFFPLFSTMLGDSGESPGGLGAIISNVAQLLPISSPLGAAALLLIIVFLAKNAGILIRDLLVAYTSAKILYNVKQQILERYSGAEYQFMVDNQQGALIYKGLAAPSSVSSLHMVLMQMIISLMKVVSITVVLLSLLLYPALAFIGLALVYYWAIHYISKKVSFTLGQGRVKAGTEEIVITNEFLNGFRQIISFNMARRWVERFEQQNRTYSELYAKDLAWRVVPRPFLELSVLGLVLGLVLLLKANSPGTFAEDLAALGIFAVALVQILPPLNALGGTRLQIMGGLPNVQLAHQILTSSVPARREGHREITSLENAVVFEDVSFTHNGRDPLLEQLNMTLVKGEVTAIVGPSGSGKTTLINLILGLFQPSAGRITVDGVPLQELTHESWLGRIGFVSQDPFVYNTTIEENIRFNRSGHSKEDLMRAATIANAYNFVSELPEGFDTLVGDRGIKLSGGQQQRICIARAVLDSPEILIFDEATSSLDSIAERQVQQAIDSASAHRTVIIIAHRLSTIRHADKIIVIDNGKVIEQGTHEELLTSNGHYSRQVAASV